MLEVAGGKLMNGMQWHPQHVYMVCLRLFHNLVLKIFGAITGRLRIPVTDDCLQ